MRTNNRLEGYHRHFNDKFKPQLDFQSFAEVMNNELTGLENDALHVLTGTGRKRKQRKPNIAKDNQLYDIVSNDNRNAYRNLIEFMRVISYALYDVRPLLNFDDVADDEEGKEGDQLIQPHVVNINANENIIGVEERKEEDINIGHEYNIGQGENPMMEVPHGNELPVVMVDLVQNSNQNEINGPRKNVMRSLKQYVEQVKMQGNINSTRNVTDIELNVNEPNTAAFAQQFIDCIKDKSVTQIIHGINVLTLHNEDAVDLGGIFRGITVRLAQGIPMLMFDGNMPIFVGCGNGMFLPNHLIQHLPFEGAITLEAIGKYLLSTVLQNGCFPGFFPLFFLKLLWNIELGDYLEETVDVTGGIIHGIHQMENNENSISDVTDACGFASIQAFYNGRTNVQNHRFDEQTFLRLKSAILRHLMFSFYRPVADGIKKGFFVPVDNSSSNINVFTLIDINFDASMDYLLSQINTSEEMIEYLTFPNAVSEHDDIICELFKIAISSLSLLQLRKLYVAVTGSNVHPPAKEVKVYLKILDVLPTVHLCTYTMDLSTTRYEIQDYQGALDRLLEDLGYLISANGNFFGFA